MSVNARWRQNPFTDDMNDILIEDEEHTIEYITELNIYGFYANEGVAAEPVILVQDNTAQTTFTEQPRTIAPNAGQFRVDYDAEDYYNTGLVQCNAADNGKAVLFTYRGTGTLVHPSFRRYTQYNFAGQVDFGDEVEVSGDIYYKAWQPIEVMNAFPNSEEYTTAGNYTITLDTESALRAFVELVAGGGAGGNGGTAAAPYYGGGGGGGGGGERKYFFIDLRGYVISDAIDSIAITVGAAGANSTVALKSGGTTIVTYTAAAGTSGENGANGNSSLSFHGSGGRGGLGGYTGQSGTSGTADNNARGGNGGAYGGNGGLTGANGGAASNAGGGGGGGGAGATTGGAGAAGLCRIWW